MTREIRPYSDSDFEAVVRQWREIGWIDDSEQYKESLRVMLSVGSTEVGLIDGEAEAMTHTTPGSFRFGDADLDMLAISAVTTSRVSRRLGFASELTARALGRAAEQGAALAALGIFDQGFYDRLGFGTSSYDHRVTFDPAMLTVDPPSAVPVRLSANDYEEIHSLMMRRHRGHGSCVLYPPEIVQHGLMSLDHGFGLGFREKGRLTHFFFADMKHARGPYDIRWIGYESAGQLLELLGLLKSVSDQVISVTMIEPQEVQLQDLLKRPIRERTRTGSSKYAVSNNALANWQARILDVGTCLGKIRWEGAPFTFNLSLTDPLADLEHDGWRGVGGEYVVRLGDQTTVEIGHADSADTLTCGVNGLSRLWLGVLGASNLALLDQLSGPAPLLDRLERVFRMPTPHLGWEF